jgi:hypothetical protein
VPEDRLVSLPEFTWNRSRELLDSEELADRLRVVDAVLTVGIETVTECVLKDADDIELLHTGGYVASHITDAIYDSGATVWCWMTDCLLASLTCVRRG